MWARLGVEIESLRASLHDKHNLHKHKLSPQVRCKYKRAMATGWTAQAPDELPELVVTPATFGRESPMKVAYMQISLGPRPTLQHWMYHQIHSLLQGGLQIHSVLQGPRLHADRVT